MLRNVRVTYKLLILWAMLIVPLIWFATIVAEDLTAARRETEYKRAGLVLSAALSELQWQVAQLRSERLSGGAFGDEVERRRNLSQAIAAVKAFRRETAEFHTFWRLWKESEPRLQALLAGPGEDLFAVHSQAVRDLVVLQSLVRRDALLAEDPDRGFHYATTAVTTDLPELAEAVARTRSMAALILDQRTMTLDERDELVAALSRIPDGLQRLRTRLSFAVESAPRLRPPVEAHLPELEQRLERLTRVVDEAVLDPPSLTEDVVRVYAQGREAIELMAALANDLRDALDAVLDDRLDAAVERYGTTLVVGLIAAVALALLALVLALSISRPLEQAVMLARRIAAGEREVAVEVRGRDEIATLLTSLRDMQAAVRATEREMVESHRALELRDRQSTGLNKLAAAMRGDRSPEDLAAALASFLTPFLGAVLGAVFVADGGAWTLLGTHARRKGDAGGRRFGPGEGLVGQAAVDRRPMLLTPPPEGYLRIEGGLGATGPHSVLIYPVCYQDEVPVVIELGALHPLGEAVAFLDLASDAIAISFTSAFSRQQIRDLLGRTQAQSSALRGQADEMEAQANELRETNEALATQARALRDSEQHLREQQVELEAANQELEEKSRALRNQRALLEERNRALEEAKEHVEAQAEAVRRASRYKSEFLANMSHELRTPLNSLLILARDLAENRTHTLTPQQVEAAGIIHQSGSELLSLINDILDLSKIEAGRMDIHLDDVDLARVAEAMRSHFVHMAREKGLTLAITLSPDVPRTIRTDERRLGQILRNLLGNAIKFTPAGQVTLSIEPVPEWIQPRSGGPTADYVAFTVTDTGIGIPPEKQQLVFDAFQQVDGSISRRYGGTGLGLSISRELAVLLRGEIHLRSEPGKGSTFTLLLPRDRAAEPLAAVPAPVPPPRPPPPPVAPPPSRVLIVEDDAAARRRLHEVLADAEVAVEVDEAETGASALEHLERRRYGCVVLDLGLPDMSGFDVLDGLRARLGDRAPPVIVHTARDLSREEEASLSGLAEAIILKGEASETRLLDEVALFLHRLAREQPTPAPPPPSPGDAVFRDRRVLIVDDDMRGAFALARVLGDRGLRVDIAPDGRRALEKLTADPTFDLVLMDVMMPDMDGLTATRRIREQHDKRALPIIALTAKAMASDREAALAAGANDYLPKPVDIDRLLVVMRIWLAR